MNIWYMFLLTKVLKVYKYIIQLLLQVTNLNLKHECGREVSYCVGYCIDVTETLIVFAGVSTQVL